MDNEELKALYDEYVANGGTASFNKWKKRQTKNDKRKTKRETARKEKEEAIEKARQSLENWNKRNKAIEDFTSDLTIKNHVTMMKQHPMYTAVNNILGDVDYDDAQNALNRARRDKIITNNDTLVEMKKFLSNNEYLFYDDELNRIPYSEAGDLIDIDEEVKKFTAKFDEEHPGWNGLDSETVKQSTEQSTKEATKQTSRNTTKEAVKESTQETLEQAEKKVTLEGSEKLGKTTAQKIFNKRVGGVLMNSFFAISDYKDARNQGKGVVQAAVKSGGLFVAGEVLQGAMLPVMLAKQAPQMIVNGVEGLQRMTRGMNSMTRFQTFGEAEFHDSPQLATMRQAGMEMAKMSQYNLQQAIMGNEASNMHRI